MRTEHGTKEELQAFRHFQPITTGTIVPVVKISEDLLNLLYLRENSKPGYWRYPYRARLRASQLAESLLLEGSFPKLNFNGWKEKGKLSLNFTCVPTLRTAFHFYKHPSQAKFFFAETDEHPTQTLDVVIDKAMENCIYSFRIPVLGGNEQTTICLTLN